MTVRLCFTAGSLAGCISEIPPSGALSVGRSRTCDLKASEPDVSGRHLVFRRSATEGVSVEVVSSRSTLFNGTKVSMGDTFAVKNGDTFRCGSTLGCRVECADDDVTVPPPAARAEVPSDSDKTVPPGAASTSAPSVSTPLPTPPAVEGGLPSAPPESAAGNTIAIQTRIASDEELDGIRRAQHARRTRRVIAIIVPALLFLAAMVGTWLWLKPKTEEFVSWPENDKGQSMDRNVLVAPYLAMTVPDSAACRVEKGDGNVEVWTYAGIRHDVPVHFQAVTTSSTNELTIGRDRSFDAWLRAQRVADASFNPSTDRRRMWVGKQSGNGILVNYVTYTRRIGEEDYYGYLLYLRFEDTVHAIFAEVLLRDMWRSDPLLRGNLSSFVWFAAKRIPTAWEGHDSIRPGDCPKCDIEEAERYFSSDRKLAAKDWDAVWYRVRSGLVKSKRIGNEKMLEKSRKLLLELRTAQANSYAYWRNSWNEADRRGDSFEKQRIQTESEAAFSEVFRNYDYRYDCIKRKDWK